MFLSGKRNTTNNEPKKPNMKNTTKQFETGKTYSTRSICDSECIFSYSIIKRTAKTVTVKSMGNLKTSKIRHDENGAEWCFPDGQYSMCPVIRA